MDTHGETDAFASLASQDLVDIQNDLRLTLSAVEEYLCLPETRYHFSQSEALQYLASISGAPKKRKTMSSECPIEMAQESYDKVETILSLIEESLFQHQITDNISSSEGNRENSLFPDDEFNLQRTCEFCGLNGLELEQTLKSNPMYRHHFMGGKDWFSASLYQDPNNRTKSIYCHFLCSIWCPLVSVDDKGKLLRVSDEIKRSRKLVCIFVFPLIVIDLSCL